MMEPSKTTDNGQTAQDQGPPQPWPGMPAPVKHKHKRQGWEPWHHAAFAAGLTVVGLLAGLMIGITVGRGWTPAPAVSTAAGQSPSPKPTPTYDLGGYRFAITGDDRHAFASALAKLRADNTAVDFSAAGVDASRLIEAARVWLKALNATNPPPADRAGKLAYINAATLGSRAAWAIHNALTDSNIGLYQRGADLANRAATALSRVPGARSGAGPSGS